MNDYSAIGKRGQARRRQLGLSVAVVADRMGVNDRSVYQYEHAGVGTLAVIELWAQALEMDPRELAFGRREQWQRFAHERAADRRRSDARRRQRRAAARAA